MPYVIESDGTLGAFPDGCAYCGTRQANTTFVQPFSKLKLSKIPGNAESETLRVEMPACEPCARWFRTTRTLLFSIGFVAITGLVWCVLLTMWLDNQLPIYAWFTTIALWTGLRLWRGWRRGALRLAYFNTRTGTVLYAMRDEAYARELGEMNDLPCSYKRLLIRLS